MSRIAYIFLTFSVTLTFTQTTVATPTADANNNGEITRAEYLTFTSNAFNQQDKNFDGRITQQEKHAAMTEYVREKLQKQFKDMDDDGDGKITSSEFDAFNAEKNEKRFEKNRLKTDKWFDKVDTNGNGHISRLEYDDYLGENAVKQHEKLKERTQKQFNAMDLDKDGEVTEFEFVDKGRAPGTSGQDSKPSNPFSDLHVRSTPSRKKRIRRDSNSDGVITKLEDREYNEAAFEKMDVNNDGAITKKENARIFSNDNATQFMTSF